MPKALASSKPGKAARKGDTAERLFELQDQALRQFGKAARSGLPRECPLFGHEGLFAPVGMPPRLDSRRRCRESRERHRLFKLWLDREAPITRTQLLLHFAPERRLSRLLRGLAGEYVTADPMRPAVDLKRNIEALDPPDASFDVVCYGLMRGETVFILKKPRSRQTTKIGPRLPTAAKKD
ncbi:MAG TPA: hypothetical protein PKA03_04615 [Tabrizicola sp.]|nr:hypothetical protein [Tabrizicola sp.]